MADPNTLRILLLGSPVIAMDQQPLNIQRRLLRWMLFYLAGQKEMVGRSDLMLLFWPDENEEDARRHLRETLSKLRAQLPDPSLIITQQDKVGLDPLRTYSDVLEFQALFAQTARVCAQTPASIPLTQSVYQTAVRAVRLWRTGRFLAGAQLPESDMLSDWQLQTSQQLENQRQRLLERLVDHDIASGDVESAMQRLREALEYDETNETLHFRLLQLLHQQGRSSEAINYCTYLEERFRREGFESLPPALLSLKKKVQETSGRVEASPERPAWPSLEEIQAPFVGRTGLLQGLQFAIRRGSPVIVFGEAGAGKSRLVRELFFSLKPAPRLLLAPARKQQSKLPFQPVIDLLRHDIHAEEWKQMDPVWVTPLALLLPELTIMRPEIHLPKMEPAQENSLLFEALRQLFLFLGTRQRFLLFLDNAQWSDGATLAALSYLSERGLFDGNGSLVLAARPEEKSPELDSFLNRPRSDFSVQRLSIEPLKTAEIDTLASYVLGEAYSNAVTSRLERETGGNPLFLLETLRLMLDYAVQAPLSAGLDRLPLSGTVHALIRERLQHLTPDDSQVLSMAAIIGYDFSIDLLEPTCMLPAEQVVQSLESLARLNLIKAIPQDRPSSAYAFVHEKIREVILLDLSPARKRLLHLRVARALEQAYPGQSQEVETSLAEHYQEAGELENALQHWLKAAVYAGRAYAREAAFHAYRQAEQIQLRLGRRAPDRAVYQFYCLGSQLALQMHLLDALETSGDKLVQHGQERQNPLLTASGYTRLAQAAERRMRPAEGLEWLAKGRPFLEQAGDPYELVEALNCEGLLQMLMARYSQANQAYEQALAAVTEIPPASDDCPNLLESIGHSRYRLSLLVGVSGQAGRARALAEQAEQDFLQAYNPGLAALSLSLNAHARYELGQYSEALETVQAGLRLIENMPLPWIAADLRGNAAQAMLARGNLQRCWEDGLAALNVAEKLRSSYLREGMYWVLGDLFHWLGDLERAEQHYRLGSQASPENFLGMYNLAQLGLVQVKQGQAESGMSQIDLALLCFEREETLLFWLRTELVKAEALLVLGQPDEAMALLEHVGPQAAEHGLVTVGLHSRVLQANGALQQGQAGQAIQLAAQAAGEAQAHGSLIREIEALTIWLEAARQGEITVPTALARRLRDRVQVMAGYITSSELKGPFQERQKAWTEYLQLV